MRGNRRLEGIAEGERPFGLLPQAKESRRVAAVSSSTSPFGQNEWLVEEMYRKFREDPSSVDPSWHEFLVDYSPESTAGASDDTRDGQTSAPSAPREAGPAPAPKPAAGDGAPAKSEEAPAKAKAEADTMLSEARTKSEQLLSEARSKADSMVNEARTRAETMLNDARTRAETLERQAREKAANLERDAQRKHAEVMGNITQEKNALEKKIETLRTFEREYRTRLKTYLESQLEELGQRGSAAPVDSGANSESAGFNQFNRGNN